MPSLPHSPPAAQTAPATTRSRSARSTWASKPRSEPQEACNAGRSALSGSTLLSNGIAPVDRFSLVHLGTVEAGGMGRDVRRGLTATQKWLPPKYFYDDRGSALFEAICD